MIAVEDKLALPARRRALDVNSLDEVPDSSFFTNRAGRVAGEAILRGPERDPAIDVEGSLVVVEAKPSGVTPGLVVRDRRDNRFVLKFDPLGQFGLLSGAEAVATRLLWAAGYNVPDNRVVDVSPEDFSAAPGVSAAHVADILARAARGPDGRVRALASRYLEGKVLGSMPWRGRRKDDPNDRVPHEERRALRGLAYFYMWINNPDSKLENALDVFEAGPDGRGRVRHYLIDFGTSLGAGDAREDRVGWWAELCPPNAGPSQDIDGPVATPARCEELRARARQVASDPLLAALAPTVDPWRFQMLEPNPAFSRRDGGDAAWASRILASFQRADLVAAARASGWPAEIQRRLVDRLESRQKSLLRSLYGRVSPLGRPYVENGAICAADLGEGLLASRGREVVVEGGQGRLEGPRVCVRPTGNGYRVLTLRVRAAAAGPLGAAMRVHALVDGGEIRIVGVER